MELPALCLSVEKGPKKGETIECKPGAVAHIGRVVRGNNLAVRDPGVSQKHLFFQFLPDASRWAVSDLDTSNGTIVNDCLIPASVPFPISDGDTIKIGESTAIFVKIIAAQRRSIVGINEDDAGEKERTGVCTRRWLRPRKGLPSFPPVLETAADVPDGGNGRRSKGRPRKRAAAASAIADATASVPKEDESLELPTAEEIIEVEAKNHRLAKGRPKKGAAASSAIADATASVQKKDEPLELPAAEEIIEVEERNLGLGKGRARRRRPTARSSAAKVSNDQDEMKDLHDSVKHPYSEADEAVEIRDALAGSCAAEEVAGCGRQENSGRGEVERPAESMEQMTLGEWFDRMEKILPLMVNDAAKDSIASLRSKAQLFGEFIAMSSTSH